jgi:hypothetical protein
MDLWTTELGSVYGGWEIGESDERFGDAPLPMFL